MNRFAKILNTIIFPLAIAGVGLSPLVIGGYSHEYAVILSFGFLFAGLFIWIGIRCGWPMLFRKQNNRNGNVMGEQSSPLYPRAKR